MKTCVEVYHHICDNLDQNLDSPECREIRKHLGECPDCTAYLDTLRQTVRLFRAIPPPPLPRNLLSRLDRLIMATRKPGPRRRAKSRAGKRSSRRT